MHRIDPRWGDLAEGYKTVGFLQGRLVSRFGRAVRVGQRVKYHKELSEWQKKRRIFIALAVLAPLSVVGLCVSAYYFREAACIIAYWVLVVVVILVTLAVAGRNYIREAMNRPEPQASGDLSVDLEGRWWERIAMKEAVVAARDKKREADDFLSLLGRSLPDEYLAVVRPLASDEMEMLLVGPSGIWVFEAREWDGRVVRQDGVWRQVRTMRGKWGRKKLEERLHSPGPDDQWLIQKELVLKLIHRHASGLGRAPAADGAGTGASETQGRPADLVQGGVVFSQPRVVLDKAGIQGNRAPYGTAKAWAERVRRGPVLEGFDRETQLKLLEGWIKRMRLAGEDADKAASAQQEAERLYDDAVRELQAMVTQLVN